MVRDALADRLSDGGDLDFTTDALPSLTEEILAALGGQRLGTGQALRDDRCRQRQPRRVEVTTHRAEQYGASSRKPEVVFSTALEADLARRDFTVNAMALSLPDLQAGRPVQRRRRPDRQEAEDAAGARGVLHRRPL